jgi:hypothetical protein
MCPVNLSRRPNLQLMGRDFKALRKAVVAVEAGHVFVKNKLLFFRYL